MTTQMPPQEQEPDDDTVARWAEAWRWAGGLVRWYAVYHRHQWVRAMDELSRPAQDTADERLRDLVTLLVATGLYWDGWPPTQDTPVPEVWLVRVMAGFAGPWTPKSIILATPPPPAFAMAGGLANEWVGLLGRPGSPQATEPTSTATALRLLAGAVVTGHTLDGISGPQAKVRVKDRAAVLPE